MDPRDGNGRKNGLKVQRMDPRPQRNYSKVGGGEQNGRISTAGDKKGSAQRAGKSFPRPLGVQGDNGRLGCCVLQPSPAPDTQRGAGNNADASEA